MNDTIVGTQITIKPENARFRTVLTATNDQTGIWTEPEQAHAAARWHRERGVEAHVEMCYALHFQSDWQTVSDPKADTLAGLSITKEKS